MSGAAKGPVLDTPCELVPYGGPAYAPSGRVELPSARDQLFLANARRYAGSPTRAEFASALAQTWSGIGDWKPAAVAAMDHWRSMRPTGTVTPAVGHPELAATLPAFSLETPAGTLSSVDLRGKVVLLTFWASWCGPCMHELPALQGIAQRLAAEGKPVTILAVSGDEKVQNYERVRRRSDLGALVFSWNPALLKQFRVTGIPATFVVDAEGTIRGVHAGYHSGEEKTLEREIRALLP